MSVSSVRLLTPVLCPQVKVRKSNKDTVLHLAVRRRDIDLARIFVDYGVQVDAQNVSANWVAIPNYTFFHVNKYVSLSGEDS